MKTCSFCQTDNMDDAKYCKGCGKALAQPLPELREREILLQVRDLLDKQVKQSEDYQRESRQYMENSRQLQDKAQRMSRRITVALICFVIVGIIAFIITSLPRS